MRLIESGDPAGDKRDVGGMLQLRHARSLAGGFSEATARARDPKQVSAPIGGSDEGVLNCPDHWIQRGSRGRSPAVRGEEQLHPLARDWGCRKTIPPRPGRSMLSSAAGVAGRDGERSTAGGRARLIRSGGKEADSRPMKNPAPGRTIDTIMPSEFPQPIRSPFPQVFRYLLALLAGVLLGSFGSTGCAPSRSELNNRLINEAWKTVRRHYVDRSALKPVPETYGAIAGMVDALGDTGHSTFLTPEMVKQFKFIERNELQGIGVRIQSKQGHVVIVAPIDGSPAQRAGLRSGDIILKVGQDDIAGWPLARVVEHVTGRPGTAVELSILNPRTGKVRQVTIIRASIKLHNLAWARLPGTAIVDLRITSFGEGLTKDLRDTLADIRRQEPEGLILDLRDNPGGLLDEAVGVASQFLSGGNVLLVRNAQGHTRPVPVEKGGAVTNVPLAVLVNFGTASAAEIVAGALQDAHRATLIGETTFGTGTVLGEFRLSDGSALLLAIEEWLTPDGHSFWHKGILPGIKVKLPDDATPLLPENLHGMSPDQLKSSDDTQLLRALGFLTHPGKYGSAAAARRDSSLENGAPDGAYRTNMR
jgi:carboxyl-terminal processing protease